MSKQFLVFLGAGLLIVGAIVNFTWMGTKGAHLTLEGKILKVRTVATDDKNSILVVDVRVNNPTRTQFMVKEGLVTLITADGKETEGIPIASTDLDRVFDYYKLLGPKYNPVLKMRDRVQGGQWLDRTIGASFPIASGDIDQRKNLKLKLVDIDGPEFEFTEH